MTAYINTITLEYPLHQGDIRLSHPEIGDEFVCPEGFEQIQETPMPSFVQATQYVVELAPQKVDGVWTRVWKVNDLTAEQIEFINANKVDKTLDAAGSAPDVIG